MTKKNKKSNIKKHIPNILSLSRIPFSILVPILYMTGYIKASIICLSIACITDLFDGKLARLWHVESKFGEYADAVGDKVLLGGILLLYGVEYSIATIPLFIGEIAISLVNLFSRYIKHKDVKSTFTGKVKTFAAMTNLVLGFISVFFKLDILYDITNVSAILIFGIQLFTLVEYINFAFKDDKNSLIDLETKKVENC